MATKNKVEEKKLTLKEEYEALKEIYPMTYEYVAELEQTRTMLKQENAKLNIALDVLLGKIKE